MNSLKKFRGERETHAVLTRRWKFLASSRVSLALISLEQLKEETISGLPVKMGTAEVVRLP